jgi:hypothetical protein
MRLQCSGTLSLEAVVGNRDTNQDDRGYTDFQDRLPLRGDRIGGWIYRRRWHGFFATLPTVLQDEASLWR